MRMNLRLLARAARIHSSLVTRHYSSHSTAMVTVLLETPPAATTSETAGPGVTLAGTSALICHRYELETWYGIRCEL